MSSTDARVRSTDGARTYARAPWQHWQLHHMRTDFLAWNADVRRSIDAYDAERQREADVVERRKLDRLAYERKLRARKREHLRELNDARA